MSSVLFSAFVMVYQERGRGFLDLVCDYELGQLVIYRDMVLVPSSDHFVLAHIAYCTVRGVQ